MSGPHQWPEILRGWPSSCPVKDRGRSQARQAKKWPSVLETRGVCRVAHSVEACCFSPRARSLAPAPRDRRHLSIARIAGSVVQATGSLHLPNSAVTPGVCIKRSNLCRSSACVCFPAPLAAPRAQHTSAFGKDADPARLWRQRPRVRGPPRAGRPPRRRRAASRAPAEAAPRGARARLGGRRGGGARPDQRVAQPRVCRAHARGVPGAGPRCVFF